MPVMEVGTQTRRHRISTVLRSEDRVTPLELFFDLVFVLAITQCTELMADDPSWQGVAEGVLVLGLLWWAWTGYAWLTSVIDPEEGEIRIAFFAAMAGLLVVALCVPGAFGDDGLLFACSYAVVRAMHVYLLYIADREDPALQANTLRLGIGTGIGCGLLIAGSYAGEDLQVGLWTLALALDMAAPYLFSAEGWRLAPSHFAERHGLILIIALGESIVAIGVGVTAEIDAGVVAAAVAGIAIAAALWWLYFDVVALVAERRLSAAEPGRVQNAMARDSYSYLHFPMIAGIILVALGMKKTLGHTDEALELVPAAALMGGTAVYLLSHVAFRWRNVHTVNRQRFALAIALLALVPLATEVDSLVAAIALALTLTALIAYETRLYGEARERVRHEGAFPQARPY
jgi:low temperature requirement protein LtrA